MSYHPAGRRARIERQHFVGGRVEVTGLGFSLKPPKSVRKAFNAVKKAVTIKNVAKVGAIVAGVALAPMAAGAIIAGAKLLGRAATGAAGGILKNTSAGAGGTPPIASVPAQSAPVSSAPVADTAPAVSTNTTAAPDNGPAMYGQAGGGATTLPTDDETPAAAGVGGGSNTGVMLGALALGLLLLSRKKG